MADKVGGNIESWCTKCREDTGHIIVALKDGKAKRVECEVCEGHHNYRKPKGAEAAAEAKKKAAARKKVTKGTRKSKKEPVSPAKEWRKLLEAQEGLEPRKYSMSDIFEFGEVLDHPSFGQGVITEILTATKFSVVFEQGRKVLAMNID